MKDRRCFVQFIHPGGEHGPDDGDIKRWNLGDHRRKFLRTTGAYVENGRPKEASIVFWGEWEPPSRVVRRFGDQRDGLPAFLDQPLSPVPERDGWRQNTDPFVFGDRFLYTGCMQHTRRGPTQLRHMLPGSVVLFGSCHARSRFVLDTVFVVAGFVDHGARDVRRALAEYVPDEYWDVTLDPWYSGSIPEGRTFRLYFGATPDGPLGEMFSFFPALPAATGKFPQFARPEIRLPGFIAPHLTQGKKIARDLSQAEIAELWDDVARQVVDAGLVLAVRADLPETEET
jgi:hypothetical protein